MKHSNRALLLCFCTCLLFFYFTAQAGAAQELEGTVSHVQGKRVSIDLSGNLIPQKGDRVDILEDIPGLGLVPLKGSWQVTRVQAMSLTAEPVGKASQPRKGQSVVIYSTNPQSAPSPSQDSDTIYTQGMNYYKGKNGVEKDYTKALALFREAAQKGSVKAKHKVGWFYDSGYAVEEDDSKAVMWYKKAAAQGYAPAQRNLGVMYQSGDGVKQDSSEGFRWTRKAALQGNDVAQYNLGRFYSNGWGG